jgi:predicted transcriptional regulator
MPTQEDRDQYARRAAQARKLAQEAADKELRETLEKMAKAYETLVAEADRIARMQHRLTTA